MYHRYFENSDLLQSSDPGLPEVADAGERLAGLKGH